MLKCIIGRSSIVFKRYNSTKCATKFTPLCENYKTLRHIHFPGITPFSQGQKIQNAMVNANLDFKKLESKIRKQQNEIASKGYKLNEYEDNLLKKILDMKPFPTLLTFEFENVYTGGKKMKKDLEIGSKIEEYEAMGCKFHQLERGGQVTWHGQGQLVAYVILDLKQFLNLSVKCFVDSVLLKAIKETLKKNYNLDSFTNANPGVFMSEKDDKIASVGCNIQRAITSYGIALNVSPDLKFLNSSPMCGLPDVSATSIKELKHDTNITIKDAGFQYAKELAKLLNITTVEHMSGEDLKL